MRRFLIIVVILGVVGGLSWLGYERFGAPRAAQAPDYETVTLTRGEIKATVSATGSVLAERAANLTFLNTGTITHVNVKTGDQVKAGQVLAELDSQDLEMAVRQAEISVRSADAQLRQLQAGPNQTDVSAAQAQLASAQAAYQQLLNGTDKDEMAAAQAQVAQAKVTLDQAQQAYDRVKDLPNVGMLPQSAQLQQATINYETAQAQFRVTSRGAKEAQVVAAQAQVAQAQAAVDKLQRGPAAEQIDIAKASVDQAQLSLEQAQRRLDNARLTAPFDGLVTAVNVVEGTLAQPGALPAIRLADASLYHIDVKVDEADVASIVPGQPVSIEMDAFADTRLAGHVDSIAPAPTENATTGVVNYMVRIAIDNTTLALREGMSATATITSAVHENAVLVPNRAVQIDRQSGKNYVERLANGVPQQVEIQLGLRGDPNSEAVQGLQAGDQIIIRNVSSLERLQQSLGTGN